jgi:hypothetical protein
MSGDYEQGTGGDVTSFQEFVLPLVPVDLSSPRKGRPLRANESDEQAGKNQRHSHDDDTREEKQ